ncbi:MAG: beta galactosidase jelly roll domain-containing protein, partial [Saprospiraceae bacterium]|nr:beta galactosidase jelly roll domain-containing protein [Saprospiraceae bacterium]
MKNLSAAVLLIFSLLTLTMGNAQIRLPQVFQDSMILQRHATIKVWGWASAGEKIELAFADKKYSATASAEGHWKVSIPAMEAGGPYTMDISGKNDIQIKEILIGDLWLCAGQSNMVHQLNIHDVTYAKDIAEANYPAIRHYKVPTQTSLQGPREDLQGGTWQAALSDNVRPFSAVAYFFALKLYEKYQVPIGLINASVGGTPIEAWMSEDGFAAFPDHLKRITQNKDTAYVNSRMSRRSNASNSASSPPQDKGLTGPEPWYSRSFTPKNWRRINIPGYWEDQGIRELNGVVWYRKEIDLPRSMAGQAAKVFLGRIVDADQLYINGEQVGRTTYQYPQRRYKVRAGLLEEGKNTFVVRVRNNRGKGGFVPDKPYCIFTEEDTIDLKGYWQYKVGQIYIPISRSATAPPR